MTWHDVFAAMAAHWQAMGMTGGVLGIAIIHTWPEMVPRSFQDWWTWMRDAFQTAIPAGRTKEKSPDPIQPQPKE